MTARPILSALAACFLVLAASFPAVAQDAAEIVLRLNRLEGQVRQLSGQVEELAHENRLLRDQLQRFQEDVEFRLDGPAAGSPSAAPGAGRPTAPPGAGAPRRGDAFDPSANPGAPGAPRPLGSTPPSTPSSSPLPLSGALLADPNSASAGALIPPEAADPQSRRPSVAATTPEAPRDVYDGAYAFLLQGQYERAEMGFRQFLQSHPRDELVPNATYWLGETYAQRGRPREAAEQFLKVSTEHPSSPMAPRALLSLGSSLAALGARDQACATFAEIGRQYPQASVDLRDAIGRERQRAGCA